MEELSCQAIVLRRFDFGETDRIVWLLTEPRGRLGAFAAGARRSQRRFAGSLEPATIVEVRLTPPRRGDLWRLAEAEPLPGQANLRASLEAIACAEFACEVAIEFCREADPVPAFYRLLNAFLRILCVAAPHAAELYGFLMGALEAAGLAPQFARCARCGGPPVPPEHFDSAEGGRLCHHCPPRSPTATPCRTEPLDALAALQSGRASTLPRDARALLWRHLEQQLGHPLKSRPLLEELGM